MQESLYVTGIVLKQSPFGEYDRLVCLLTRRKREDHCIRKRCQKAGQPTCGSDQPFCFWYLSPL